MSRLIYIFEPHKLEVFLIWANDAEITRLDDEENYVIVDPEHKQCFVGGNWINIPEGKFAADNQLAVVQKG